MKTEVIVIEKNGTDRPWEGCINSVNYVIERGTAVEVPCEVAAVIRRSEAEKAQSRALLDKFTSERGLKLY